MIFGFLKFVVVAALTALTLASPALERRGLSPAAVGISNSQAEPPSKYIIASNDPESKSEENVFNEGIDFTPAGTEGMSLIDTYMVGKVTVQVYETNGPTIKRDSVPGTTINLTGQNCGSFCYDGAGGGPNEGDCAVISATFGSRTDLFTAGPYSAFFLFYNSCQYVLYASFACRSAFDHYSRVAMIVTTIILGIPTNTSTITRSQWATILLVLAM